MSEAEIICGAALKSYGFCFYVRLGDEKSVRENVSDVFQDVFGTVREHLYRFLR